MKKIKDIAELPYLSRQQASRALQVTIRTIRRYEKEHLLHPITLSNGHKVYLLEDLQACFRSLKRKNKKTAYTSGELAAELFTRFDAGQRDLRPIVKDLSLEPDAIRELHSDWYDNDLDKAKRAKLQKEQDEAYLKKRKQEMDQELEFYMKFKEKQGNK